MRSILGDINPTSAARTPRPRRGDSGKTDEAMVGGSQHDRSEHSGSREVTEGVSGGTGTEVGGTGNYRQGSGGATGTDIGSKPE
jgi:hypothetical protein